jgi:hypothetical protein
MAYNINVTDRLSALKKTHINCLQHELVAWLVVACLSCHKWSSNDDDDVEITLGATRKAGNQAASHNPCTASCAVNCCGNHFLVVGVVLVTQSASILHDGHMINRQSPSANAVLMRQCE